MLKRAIRKRFKKNRIPLPDPSKDKISEAPAEYIERLGQYCDLLADCMHVSRRYGGIPSPSSRHFYASVLFTALCTRGTSLAFIAPYSSWAKREFEHWDFASVANIARSIIELRLNFHYLCIDSCPIEEWECRWNLFNLHDCKSRILLFQDIPSLDAKPDTEGLQGQLEELVERLEKNDFFMRLPQSERNKFIKGGKAHLFALEDLAVNSGIELPLFRMMWRLLSAQIHGLPLSFYRIGNNERGTGVQTQAEVHYTTLMLSLCMSILADSRDEFDALMSGLSKE